CFWFMKSFKSALLSIRGYFIMKEWEKINWEEKFFEEDAETDFEWNDVKHVIIIPTYNESVEVLTKALNSLKNQVNISKKNLIVVLGMEERAVKAGAKERAKTLLSMYKKEFG